MLVDFLARVLTLPLFYTIIGVAVLLLARLISRMMVFSGNSRLIMRSLQQEYAKVTCAAIMQDLQSLQELLASIDFGGPIYGVSQVSLHRGRKSRLTPKFVHRNWFLCKSQLCET